MKAIYCQLCGTIDGLRAVNRISTCDCGAVRGRWADPYKGLALVEERVLPSHVRRNTPNAAWILGIHNGFLYGDTPNYKVWEDGFGIFARVESAIIRIRPGRSSDTALVPPRVFLEAEWEPQRLSDEWEDYLDGL